MSSATWHSSFHGQVEQVNVVTKYSLADALGSVRQMTDQAGTITLARTYDPGVYPEPVEGGSFN